MPRSPSTPLSLKHQVEGTKFLRDNERAALFDEQGLGKSKQLIDAVTAEVSSGSVQGALIVCPNGLKSNWADEIRKFSSLPCCVFGSGRTARRTAFRRMRSAFFVINYEAVPAELPSLKALLQFKPMALVLDEAHRIKTPDAKVTKAIHLLRRFAKRRYILTGTPVANRPEDLWSQMYFLDDGESLGETFQAFQERYRSGRNGYKNVDSLREQISKRSLRRTKDAALQLPPKTYTRLNVDLAPRQREMYEEMRAELALWVRSMSGAEVLERADAILARMIRLAQLASNPGLLDSGYRESPSKFTTLDGLLDRYLTDVKRKAIIWTSFVENIDSLKARYARHRPVVIHGDVDSIGRDRAVRAFKTDPQVRLLIANPAAAREGLTLTEADVAIYVDRTFNLVDYLQSQDRIHRISQTKPCEIVLLIASGTVDEFIDFSIEQKHRLARFAQKDVATISTEDLELRKPDVLRALLAAPTSEVPRKRRKRSSPPR
jgi:SWI/SNF-related matrix-associated actin-dependent regulator of chromatin subfamily A-like protein 1